MDTNPTTTVTTDAPHAVAIARDLNHELAAVSLAILDKEDERKDFCHKVNAEIKKLKKRQRELASEIKQGGRQIPIDFYAGAENDQPDEDEPDLETDDEVTEESEETRTEETTADDAETEH